MLTPEQEIILNPFTPNTDENISDILYLLFCDSDNTNTIYKNNFKELNSFVIEKLSNTEILVNVGICNIDKTIIQTTDTCTFNITESDNYFYGNSVVSPTGINYIMVVGRYVPTITTKDLYIGLLSVNASYINNKTKLCLFGILEITDNVITKILTKHPNNVNIKVYPYILDSGDIDYMRNI